MIRAAVPGDAGHIATIYNHYVENTIVTFEEESVSETDMRARISQGLALGPWLVAEIDDAVAGCAYASPWSARSGYRTSVETTVYIEKEQVGKGIGLELYSALIEQLRGMELHSAIGVIALPNRGSVALHEALGFRKIGEFQEVGRKLGQWVNVGYWQLMM